MKKTYNYIFAALAAALVLVACTKDIVPGKVDTDSTAVTYRTITVSFDSPTKARLDGTKPKFQDGDTILLSDQNNFDTCRVTVDNDVATIQTKLGKDKKLLAVYPMKAALCTEPNKIFEAGFDIPTKQSGKFSDANICTGEGVADKMLFSNVYPILRFYVDSTIAVSSIEIKSESYLAGNAMSITLDAGKFGTLDKVTGERVCYVAVREDVKASDLTFVSTTETQGVVERKSPSHIDLQPGVIYNAFIPYSIQVGDQKWGYCNVGAFYPEDHGLYFAWGGTQGYKYNPETFKFVNGYSFSWATCPFNNGEPNFDEEAFKKAQENKCFPDGTLALEYDAANVNWGGNWRMPKQSEFEKLINNTGTTSEDVQKNLYCKMKNTALIFPMTGNGYGDAPTNYGTYGGYLSSSLVQGGEYGNGDLVWEFLFSNSIEPRLMMLQRYTGQPIRPIYDETMSGDDAVGLQISPYTDGMTL